MRSAMKYVFDTIRLKAGNVTDSEYGIIAPPFHVVCGKGAGTAGKANFSIDKIGIWVKF